VPRHEHTVKTADSRVGESLAGEMLGSEVYSALGRQTANGVTRVGQFSDPAGQTPTEAEWEFAARAVSAGERYGSLVEIAWYADNSGRTRLDSALMAKQDGAAYMTHLDANGNTRHPIGLKRPNGFGQ